MLPALFGISSLPTGTSFQVAPQLVHLKYAPFGFIVCFPQFQQ